MITATFAIGVALMTAGPTAIVFYLLGHRQGVRKGRWERHLDDSWDAGNAPSGDLPPETAVYAADDDNEWLAGIKSRTDAFIALHCS